MNRQNRICSDCSNVDRRKFIKAAGTAAIASAATPLLFDSRIVHGAPSTRSQAETVVGQFYDTLSSEQRKVVCLPFDHELRRRISPNWHVVEPLIGSDFYNKDQQRLIDNIVRQVTSADGYELLIEQMNDDDGGIENYSVAIFGKPGDGKFQWELTGRHLTLRADGDSVDQAAFGGPIVYGHGEEEPGHNLYHHQTKKANEVFKSLDSAQAKAALLDKAPRETSVGIRASGAQFPGVSVGELSDDQQQLVKSTLKTILSPYRQEDVDEAISFITSGGGLEKLHMAFYQQGDLEDDKVWDIWRIEGPSLVCHFRGAPHVHAYINIGSNPAWSAEKVG